jgi:hypothetical protein
LYLIYVDDSGKSEKSSGTNYFCLSAIIVSERKWTEIDKKIEELKKRYAIEEIHTRDIDKMVRKFGYLNHNPKLREQILGDIYSLISQTEVVLISIIIDKPKYFIKYPSIIDCKYYAWQFLIERCDLYIDRLCKHRNQDNYDFGLIIMDEISSQQDFREYSRDFRQYGTDQKPISRIIEEPLFTPSHWRTFNQLADAIAYCSVHYSFFTKQFLTIREKFDKDENECIEGYGWKLYPE